MRRQDGEQRISIHAPTRGATQRKWPEAADQRFQSTLPREERHWIPHNHNARRRFQSTLPREERRYADDTYTGDYQFQSTLPREERPLNVYDCLAGLDFNPRSHERSDDAGNRARCHIRISIHAPTRGATKSPSRAAAQRAGFQSTLPREERPDGNRSTHNHGNFNPRSHERSDGVGTVELDLKKLFQSTLPREERPRGDGQHGQGSEDFNPRSHERSDGWPRNHDRRCSDFNPRSHERSDRNAVETSQTKTRFQSTLPREERQSLDCHLTCIR